MKAKIVTKQNNLVLEINGETVAPAAYMSYLEDNADYAGFQNAGYELFCACVYMGDCPINEFSGIRPFNDHIWKARDVFDFAPLYSSVKKIVGRVRIGRISCSASISIRPRGGGKKTPRS